MPRPALALGGAAIVVMAVAVALILNNANQPGAGGPAAPSPLSTTSTQSSPSPDASGTEPTFPALTETFTSDLHGMSTSYPRGWHARPATEPWNGDLVQQDSPFADVIFEKETDSPFIALASQPLAGQSFDEWTNGYLTKLIADDASCADTVEQITVDGAAGVLSGPCFVALVSDGQRGYLIWLYRVDDRKWFDEILAAVRLLPGEAVDATPST